MNSVRPGLEVVEVLLARDGLHDRQRAWPARPVDDRHREVPARHVPLEQDLLVVGEGGDEAAGHVGRGPRELDPERRAARRGLHDDREVEPLLDRLQRVGRAQLPEGRLAEGEELGCGDARLDEQVLGEDLVDRADAGEDPRAGVRDPEDLEELLDGAVLAVPPVERDERGVGRRGTQALDQVGPHVDRDNLVAEALERVLDARPRAKRHLPLERGPALQDGDLAHDVWARPSPVRRRGIGTTRAVPSSSAASPEDSGGVARGRARSAAAARSSPVSVP